LAEEPNNHVLRDRHAEAHRISLQVVVKHLHDANQLSAGVEHSRTRVTWLHEHAGEHYPFGLKRGTNVQHLGCISTLDDHRQAEWVTSHDEGFPFWSRNGSYHDLDVEVLLDANQAEVSFAGWFDRRDFVGLALGD